MVREALNELSVDNDDAHAEIIQKMELLTHYIINYGAITYDTERKFIMSKVNVLIFSVIVGFGFSAGVHIYITWEKIINYVWSCFIK